MLSLYRYFRQVIDDEKGQTMIEYSLMIVLIALVVAAAFPAVTDAVKAVFTDVNTKLAVPT